MAIIDSIAKAWEEGDGKVFRRYYDASPKTRMIETGGQNVGVDDLVDNHVAPEHGHLKSMQVMVHSVEVHLSADKKSAWTISDTEFKAETGSGKKIHSRGYGTMIWEKDGEWKIVHSHSSSRRVKNK